MKLLLIIVTLLIYGCQTKPQYQEGGFDYPSYVSDTNFYYYPLKNIEPKKDAFQDTYGYLFYRPFEESNLSIKPQPKETFRLSYSTAFGESVIIVLREGELIVKKGNPASIYTEDTSTLTNLENFHLKILNRRFPIEEYNGETFIKKYLDSLVKLYPELLDEKYYHKLYSKTIRRNGEKFIYTVNKLPISKKDYLSIINEINLSGFWTLSYMVKCENAPMDGYGYTLEANTNKKYKVVSVVGCPDDTTMLTKACQKIIDLANLNNEINLIWDGAVEVVEPDEHWNDQK